MAMWRRCDAAAPITRRRVRFSHREPRPGLVCNILLNASHVGLSPRLGRARSPLFRPPRGLTKRSRSLRELNVRLPPRLLPALIPFDGLAFFARHDLQKDTDLQAVPLGIHGWVS